jgi:hypothetical protein
MRCAVNSLSTAEVTNAYKIPVVQSEGREHKEGSSEEVSCGGVDCMWWCGLLVVVWTACTWLRTDMSKRLLW